MSLKPHRSTFLFTLLINGAVAAWALTAAVSLPAVITGFVFETLVMFILAWVAFIYQQHSLIKAIGLLPLAILTAFIPVVPFLLSYQWFYVELYGHSQDLLTTLISLPTLSILGPFFVAGIANNLYLLQRRISPSIIFTPIPTLFAYGGMFIAISSAAMYLNQEQTLLVLFGAKTLLDLYIKKVLLSKPSGFSKKID